MRKIIYTRPDGGLSVVSPVINTLGEREDFTEAQAEQRAWDALPSDAINPQFVDASAIPADRTFRGAWTHGGDKVAVDMGKAREIQAQRLADTAHADALAAQKQAARDAVDMTAINAAATPQDLIKLSADVVAGATVKTGA